MSNAEQPTLDEFASELGTTDEIDRSDVGTVNDGHLHRVNEIDDYWCGLREINLDPNTWPQYSLVPPGKTIVVIDPDAVERGWGQDTPLERGVYLSGRSGRDHGLPPDPVATDDDLLQFAAEAMLYAAIRICPDDEIVAVSKQHTSLNIRIRDGERERLFGEEKMPLTYAESEDPELYHGFHSIRQFPEDSQVYTVVDEPRLGLEDLRVSTGTRGGDTPDAE